MSRQIQPLFFVENPPSPAETPAAPPPATASATAPATPKRTILTGIKLMLSYRITQTILLILLMIGIAYVLFIYYQYWYSRKMLLGWWHVFDNVYMVIDGSLVQFGEFLPDPAGSPVFNVYHEDDSVDFSYKFHITPNSDAFKMTRSSTKPIKLGSAISHPFDAKTITLLMHVDMGVIIVQDDNGIEQARLTKSNEMTNEYTQVII